MKRTGAKHAYALLAVMLLSSSVALAHIRIYPTESVLGAREKYTMRVPNEKQVATIRIEGEFPKELKVYDFEFSRAGRSISRKMPRDG